MKLLKYFAADDDFFTCGNAPYGQVLELPNRRLVRPANDNDFAVFIFK